MARWTYLFASLRTNVIIDELPLTNVRMTKVLNGSGQLQAQVRLGDPVLSARNVYDLTRPVVRVVYALRDARPWWGGIIWASDYDSDTSTLDVGCADFWSYFDHRKVLEVLAALPLATSYVAGLSKIYTQQDQNVIARALVTLAQSHTAGNIGIVVDGAVSGILLDKTYEGYDLHDTGEALRELANLPEGPDIVFDVSGPDANGRPIRILRTGTPQLGQQGIPHRWDLGGNLLSYKWLSGGGPMATRVFMEGDGTDRGTKIAVAENASFYANGWPLLDTDDVNPDITDDAKLLAEGQGLLDTVKLPQVTVELTIKSDMVPSLGDFSVGDAGQMVVPAGDLFFTAGVDLPVRVLSITVTVNDNGEEQTKLTCQSVQEIV